MVVMSREHTATHLDRAIYDVSPSPLNTEVFSEGMAIDLKKNRDSIIAAWQDVSNPDSKHTWAVFGYEGLSRTLKVVEIGEGGIEDMVESLNSGKIMYAYCRVTDPNTKLPKLILVNWQGDGAQDTLKGQCASHIKDVSAVLRGAHVTINARVESDLDTEDVMKLVSKSSGANYSVHKEQAKTAVESGPVGSVYKKTVPQVEIKTQDRDKFWEKTEEEEKKRRDAEKQQKLTEQKALEQERIEREKKEAMERERKIAEHSREVGKQRRAESLSEEHVELPKPRQDAAEDDEERRTRSESLRKQRAAEAAALVKQRDTNPKQLFKERERAASIDEKAPAPVVPTKSQGNIIKQAESSEGAYKSIRQASPPPHEEDTRHHHREPSPPLREPSPPPREPMRPPKHATSPPPQPQIPNLMAQNIPKRQDSDDEQEEQDWDAPTEEDVHTNINVAYEPDALPSEAEGGVRARAVYDYQATAADEVSFDPGDLITEIEMVDDGWWIGTAPNGCRGLFPANYVELI